MNPVQCDPEIYKHGKVICHFHHDAKATEKWVRAVAAASGQRVDWSYSAGYAGVQFLGDEEQVRAAIEALGPPPGCCHWRLYERERERPITLIHLGSMTDLATDIAFELTPGQGRELAAELERFLVAEPGKFRGGRSSK